MQVRNLDIFNGRTIRAICSDGDIRWADEVTIYFTDGTSIVLSGPEGVSIESDELSESQRFIMEQQTKKRIEQELKRDEELKKKYPGIT